MEDSDPVVLIPGRWGQWASGLSLPSTLQGYLFFVLCLLILAFTMALHITLSAEGMRLDRELTALEEEYARIERINANLVWEISESTSLAEINAQAVALGYAPVTEFKYVVMGSGDPAAAAGATGATAEAGAALDATGAASLAPSAANPVIVLGGLQANGAQAAQPSALIQTPGMELPPSAGAQAATAAGATAAGATAQAAAQVTTVAAGTDATAGIDVSPDWRTTFSVEGLRAAAGETWSWIQDRLPRRR